MRPSRRRSWKMSETHRHHSPKKSHYRCLLQRMGQHMPWKSGIFCCLYYCILSPLNALKTLSAGPWPTPETSSNGNRSAVTSSQSELTFYSDSLTFYSDSFKSNVSVHDPLVTRHSLFGCLAHSVVINIKGPRVVKHPFHPSSSSGHVSPSQDGPPHRSHTSWELREIWTLGFWLKQNLEEKTLQKHIW